jgi:hypothetical protein
MYRTYRTNEGLTWHRHLVNDGVEETPPSPPDTSSLVDEEEEEEEREEDASSWSPCSQDGERHHDDDGDDLFIDLAGANVGFQNWHPVSVTAHGDRLAGQSGLGGVWEWTSSTLRRYEGFEPMALYPLYTGKADCSSYSFRSLSPIHHVDLGLLGAVNRERDTDLMQERNPELYKNKSRKIERLTKKFQT